MTLHPSQVRFDPEIHEFVAAMAAKTGVSFSEYVRGAALARAMATFVREYPAAGHQWDELYRTAQNLVSDHEPLEP